MKIKTIFAVAILIVFILIQYTGFFVGKDYWPFSHFPMYSKIPAKKQYSWARYEVTVDGNPISLDLENSFKPYSAVRFNYTLNRYFFRGQEDKVQELLRVFEDNIRSQFPQAQIDYKVVMTSWKFDPNTPTDEKADEKIIFSKSL